MLGRHRVEIKSKLPACLAISLALRDSTTSSAPSRSASSRLLSDVVKTTHAHRRRGNFTPYAPVRQPHHATFLLFPRPRGAAASRW